MNETYTLAVLKRQPTNRCVTRAELRIDICQADGRRFVEIGRWEEAGGEMRKTSHVNRVPLDELDIVIDALQKARSLSSAA